MPHFCLDLLLFALRYAVLLPRLSRFALIVASPLFSIGRQASAGAQERRKKKGKQGVIGASLD
jgi:hypothetical protein